MSRGHRRAPRRSSLRRIALVAAPLATCGLIGAGIALTEPVPEATVWPQASGSLLDAAIGLDGRDARLSRDAERAAEPPSPKSPAGAEGTEAASLPAVKRRLWTTAALDLRLKPREAALVRGEFPELRRIAVTGARARGYAQVIVKGQVRWVTAGYLAARKPEAPAALPIAGSPCPGTSSVESGLTANAIAVYRAVCNKFPQITSYGGYSAHGEHSSGRAVDVMTSDAALGDAIAEFLRAHAAELHLYDIIWRQRIWTQERGGEGWRAMSDRGSATANHYDHVHVSTY